MAESFALTAPELRERAPTGSEWSQYTVHGLAAELRALSFSCWRSGPIRVISALENAEYPDGAGFGPQWHISITNAGKRPKPHHVRRALRAFGMVGSEEDNHHPGNARHFWLPVDPAHRVDCQCKAEEQTLVEPDGYTWTNPRPGTGEDCRGCEMGRILGKPCPVHPAGGATP